MNEFLYFYLGPIVRVIDGDTVVADIDLGLHTWIHGERLRLARINTPEVRGEQRTAGLAARDYLAGLVLGKEVYIHTIKDTKEKYGRYLAEIGIERDGAWFSVNDEMVLSGHAVYQEY